MAEKTVEQQLEDLTMEKSAIQQLMAMPQWQVFQTRLAWGIENYLELLLTSNLEHERTQAARERVLAYRELQNLPGLIDEQIKRLEEPTTEG